MAKHFPQCARGVCFFLILLDASAEKAAPHEAAYDAFLCGSGKMLLQHLLFECDNAFPALWLCCLFSDKKHLFNIMLLLVT